MLILVLIFSGIFEALHGQIKPAPVFSNNMVLQRHKPVTIDGKFDPGKRIEVTFGHETKVANVLEDSSWHIQFPARSGGMDAHQIIIRCGTEVIIFDNILIGDVWLCIGQSNMEWPLQKEAHFSEETNKADLPLLRSYFPIYAGKNIFGSAFSDSVVKELSKENFFSGSWQVVNNHTAAHVSAVAYYFGKEITQQTNVPVGLLIIALGGAPLETFIDPAAMYHSNTFRPKVTGNWLENNSLPVWVRERGK